MNPQVQMMGSPPGMTKFFILVENFALGLFKIEETKTCGFVNKGLPKVRHRIAPRDKTNCELNAINTNLHIISYVRKLNL